LVVEAGIRGPSGTSAIGRRVTGVCSRTRSPAHQTSRHGPFLKARERRREMRRASPAERSIGPRRLPGRRPPPGSEPAAAWPRTKSERQRRGLSVDRCIPAYSTFRVGTGGRSIPHLTVSIQAARELRSLSPMPENPLHSMGSPVRPNGLPSASAGLLRLATGARGQFVPRSCRIADPPFASISRRTDDGDRTEPWSHRFHCASRARQVGPAIYKVFWPLHMVRPETHPDRMPGWQSIGISMACP